MAGNHMVELSVLVFGGETCGFMQTNAVASHLDCLFGHHKHCIKIFMCIGSTIGFETAYILHVIFHPVHLYMKN